MNLKTLKDRRVKGGLIEMYKVVSGREDIDWVYPPNRISNLELEGPASGVRRNCLRLHREHFKSKYAKSFAHSVTVRHKLFLNRIVPI